MTLPYERISIEQVATFPRPGMNVPANIRFAPGDRAVTYLFSSEGSLVRSLWRYDLETGERSIVAGPSSQAVEEEQISREEELRRERLRLRELGVTDYHFAKDAVRQVLLVPSASGIQVRIGDDPWLTLPGTQGALDPRLSDDGSQVGFVRGGDLFVTPVASGAPRRLTETAEDGLSNGLAEFIAQEELDQDRGFWWSPDGSRIAFVEADSRHVPKYSIVHQGKDTIDVEEHRYPFAGKANAHVRLGVADVATGGITWMDLGEDPDIYLARVDWRPGNVLTAQVLSRDQESLQLLSFNGETGSSRVLLDERRQPWINLHSDLRYLESGEFLWSSEASGFRHLSLHTPTGAQIRQLSGGDWMVTAVAGVDKQRRTAHIVGTRDDPRQRHLYAVSLDTGKTTRLTAEPGWHDCTVSRDGAYFIDRWSSLEHSPRVAIRRTDASLVTMLHEAPDADAVPLGLRPPAFFDVPIPGGPTLHGAVYNPPALEPGRRYPLIVSVYGGPHAQRVADDWTLTVDLRAQYLAQEGFVVIKVDNRGSANRGLAFEAPIDHAMGSVEVDDQAAAVRHVAQWAHVDASRTGVYGWSYGGYMTCLCLMKEPGIFKVGVAGAPVTDWDGYDTGYTERYMGTPQENPDGYRESSVLSHVERLEGKLLLVHGGIDENVHFRHTARLITALTAAQKPYDLVLFPEERHMPRGAKGLEYQERRLVDYFKANL